MAKFLTEIRTWGKSFLIFSIGLGEVKLLISRSCIFPPFFHSGLLGFVFPHRLKNGVIKSAPIFMRRQGISKLKHGS